MITVDFMEQVGLGVHTVIRRADLTQVPAQWQLVSFRSLSAPADQQPSYQVIAVHWTIGVDSQSAVVYVQRLELPAIRGAG